MGAVFTVCLVLVLAMATAPSSSDGAYCVCNTGVSDQVLQKNIDYACGSGADCSPILQNGACYNPDTVRDHCNYAVNSYYQRKGQVSGSCDFQGTATITQTPPPSAGSGCVYQSSPSNGGGTTTTAGGGGGGGTTMGGIPNTGTITIPGSTGNPSLSLGPTASGSFGNTDSSEAKRGTISLHWAFLTTAVMISRWLMK